MLHTFLIHDSCVLLLGGCICVRLALLWNSLFITTVLCLQDDYASAIIE